MKEMNLRDFYPWNKENVIIEVTEEVEEELLAGQRYIKASRRRVYRNKAHYSLDAEDGIEYSACFSNPSPQELIERMERFEYLCHALNSLPDAQGQRVFEHYLLGHSVKAIAAAEGMTERSITAAIQRGCNYSPCECRKQQLNHSSYYAELVCACNAAEAFINIYSLWVAVFLFHGLPQ